MFHFAFFFTHSAIRLTHNATTFLHPVRARIPLCGDCVSPYYIHSVYTSFDRMVSELVQVVGEYVQQLQGMSFVPPFSFGRGMYRDDGGPNRLFFMYLFWIDCRICGPRCNVLIRVALWSLRTHSAMLFLFPVYPQFSYP